MSYDFAWRIWQRRSIYQSVLNERTSCPCIRLQAMHELLVRSVWIMALHALRCRYAILNVQSDTVRWVSPCDDAVRWVSLIQANDSTRSAYFYDNSLTIVLDYVSYYCVRTMVREGWVTLSKVSGSKWRINPSVLDLSSYVYSAAVDSWVYQISPHCRTLSLTYERFFRSCYLPYQRN